MCPNTSIKERDQSTEIVFPSGKDVKKGTEEWPQSNTVYKGRQVTVSEGHRKNRNTGKYDSGGPFFSARRRWDVQTRDVKIEGRNNLNTKTVRYSGPIVIALPSTTKSAIFSPSRDDSYLDKYGADAIHAVDPTNPNAELGVDLGEIIHDRRISLPGIQAWKMRTEKAKAAGSEYLSAQFGWLPLVNDMKNVSQSVRDGNKIMENYQNHSGTYTHREFEFDPIVNVSEVGLGKAHCSYSTNFTGYSSFHQGTPGEITLQRRETIRRWFSGTFTYASNPGSQLGRCLGIGSEADKLFGLSLSPDLVWELTPWSWAIDWFSNAGGVISNAQSFALAGLVMPYGYIMEETSIEDTYVQPSTGLTGVLGPAPITRCVSTIKRRRAANPFGFGVGWEGLTPTQLAITAALGITRVL